MHKLALSGLFLAGGFMADVGVLYFQASLWSWPVFIVGIVLVIVGVQKLP